MSHSLKCKDSKQALFLFLQEFYSSLHLLCLSAETGVLYGLAASLTNRPGPSARVGGRRYGLGAAAQAAAAPGPWHRAPGLFPKATARSGIPSGPVNPAWLAAPAPSVIERDIFSSSKIPPASKLSSKRFFLHAGKKVVEGGVPFGILPPPLSLPDV